MITEKQRAARRFFIGSSDAAAACGVDPYKSRVMLWMEKTGRIVPDNLDGNDFVRFGNLLEPVIAAEYARRHGFKPEDIQPGVDTIFNGIRCANIDYRIAGRILECKTAGAWLRQAWDTGIPDNYRMQVEHQLITCEEHDAALAALIGGNYWKDFQVERSAELSELVIARENEFFDFVLEDTAPPAETVADVALLIPVDNCRRMPSTPELDELADEVRENVRLSIEHAGKADNARDRIAQIIGEHAEVVDLDGRPVVTFRAPSGARIKWRSVAAELAQHVARSTWEQAVRKHSAAYERELRVLPSRTPPPARSTKP